jgi:DNA-binding SARP family transcriptional activator
VEIRLLGAVEAWAGKGQLPLGPRKQRFLLAVLALNVNRVMHIDRLVALTWPDKPPYTAQHAIHVRISQLRAVLAMAAADRAGVEIDTQGSTYALRGDGMRVDAHRFRALVARSRSETNDHQKVVLLREALDMWHGPPLADAASPEVAAQLCRGLQETRLAATEEWLDAELRLGRHWAVVDELIELTALHPHRQHLLGRLMLALYRAGRTPDALAAYRAGYRQLVNELGLEPELQLQRLHTAILRGDPALDLPRPAGQAGLVPLSTVALAAPA